MLSTMPGLAHSPGAPWGDLNSYGPRYTVGTVSQWPCGAGEGSDHSSPLSRHGFRSAFFPLNRLYQKFTKKISCVANNRYALTVMNTFIGCIGFRKSYCVGS